MLYHARFVWDEVSAALVERARVTDLGRPLFDGVPQAPVHPTYRHVLSLRHGDLVRCDGGTSASDLVITGTHVGTHIDALGHIGQDGLLHGGVSAETAQRTGRLDRLGIDKFEPLVCRGVMLDVPAVLGLDVCPGDLEIGAELLQAAAERQGTPIGAGDAVLIRTGWGRHFEDEAAFVGRTTGTPGIGEEGAVWLAERSVRVTGAETISFESVRPDRAFTLPAHRVLLVEHAVNIVEVLDLEQLAREQLHEFVLVLAPLRLVGATGSPVRPLAITFG